MNLCHRHRGTRYVGGVGQRKTLETALVFGRTVRPGRGPGEWVDACGTSPASKTPTLGNTQLNTRGFSVYVQDWGVMDTYTEIYLYPRNFYINPINSRIT